jgi:hypothetical protein
MRRPGFVLLLLLASAASCSLTLDAQDAPPGADEVRSFREGLHDAVAAAWSSRCDGGTLEWAAQAAGVNVGMSYGSFAVAAWEGGNVFFDKRLGQACISEVRSASTCADLYAARFDPGRACKAAWHGRIPLGQVCYTQFDCVLGTYCALDDGNSIVCPGMCMPIIAPGGLCSGRPNACPYGTSCQSSGLGAENCYPSLLGRGETCGIRVGACAPGLRCRTSGTVSFCDNFVARGDACASSDECDPNSFCAGLSGSTSGTCQQRIGAGLTCAAVDHPCQLGTVCGSSGTCEVETSSGACGLLSSGDTASCVDGTCKAGTCVPYAWFGQACDGARVCDGAGVCRNGVCGLPCR